jgi:hypothetical protein
VPKNLIPGGFWRQPLSRQCKHASLKSCTRTETDFAAKIFRQRGWYRGINVRPIVVDAAQIVGAMKEEQSGQRQNKPERSIELHVQVAQSFD